MARLEVRPVTCQTTSSGWSQTLTLSTPPHVVDPAIAPAWVITLSLVGTAAADRGPELLATISRTFETIELKTPEALYQTLNQLLQQDLHASVAAMCLTGTHSTIIGKGNFRINLWRNERLGTVIAGTTSDDWQVVEGPFYDTDRWWLAAGDIEIIPPLDVMQQIDIEPAISELHASLISLPDPNLANIFLFSTPTSSVIEPTSIETPPVQPLQSSPRVLKKRRVMIIGWLLLLALVISIWFGAKAHTQQQLSAAYSKLDQHIITTITSATLLATTDQTQSRQQLRDLQDQVTEAKSTFESDNKWLTKWQELNQKVIQSYQQLAGETALNDIPVWFSLSVIKPDFLGNKLTIAGDTIVVLDKTTGTLAKIGINAKRGESLATGLQLKNATALAADTTKALVVTDVGIISSALGKIKTTTTVIANDAEWQQPSFLGIYNGNVYLVDQGAGLIWRYSATAEGLATKNNWFGSGVSIAGVSIQDFAIDGDVWILRDGGSLARYRRGAPLSFSLSGLDQALSSSVTALAVAEEADKIALLDAGNQRVVICTKQGSYVKQIKWTGFSDAQDISFSADSNTLYILKNGAIYAASL